MANHAAEDGDNIVFIYTGGDQVVPHDVIHILIDESVTDIPDRCFFGRRLLETIECHDNVRKIGRNAFTHCHSLRWVKLPGVVDIGILAFANCINLEYIEFGNKLVIIREDAFRWCTSLRHVVLPSIQEIRSHAFMKCTRLSDVELLSDELGTIGRYTFAECPALRSISIPLKDGIIVGNSEFGWSNNLTSVNLIGEIHQSISCLHLKSWRNDMYEEINRINQVLSTTSAYANDKTDAIREWIHSVIRNMEHYKVEHSNLLMEAATLLELDLWSIKLDNERVDEGDVHRRAQCRVNCGSNIIIRNVLDFLKMPP